MHRKWKLWFYLIQWRNVYIVALHKQVDCPQNVCFCVNSYSIIAKLTCLKPQPMLSHFFPPFKLSRMHFYWHRLVVPFLMDNVKWNTLTWEEKAPLVFISYALAYWSFSKIAKRSSQTHKRKKNSNELRTHCAYIVCTIILWNNWCWKSLVTLTWSPFHTK